MEQTKSKDNTWLLLALAGIGIYWWFNKKSTAPAAAVPVTTNMPTAPVVSTPSASADIVPVTTAPVYNAPITSTPSVDIMQPIFDQPIYTTQPVYNAPVIDTTPVVTAPTPDIPSAPVDMPVYTAQPVYNAPVDLSVSPIIDTASGGGGIIENLSSSQYAFMDSILQSSYVANPEVDQAQL